MFVLELEYTADLDRIDAVLPDHVTWLEGHYAAGRFLASGRKVPRDGGIILATAPDRGEIESLCATDPFVQAGLCNYRITEFVASKTAPALEGLREALPTS